MLQQLDRLIFIYLYQVEMHAFLVLTWSCKCLGIKCTWTWSWHEHARVCVLNATVLSWKSNATASYICMFMLAQSGQIHTRTHACMRMHILNAIFKRCIMYLFKGNLCTSTGGCKIGCVATDITLRSMKITDKCCTTDGCNSAAAKEAKWTSAAVTLAASVFTMLSAATAAYVLYSE